MPSALKESNDGSDFSFRMTVENKYKKAADNRKLLEKLNSMQAFYSLASGLMSGALLGRAEPDPTGDETLDPWWIVYTSATSHIQTLSFVQSLPLYTLILAAVSSMIGYAAVKSNRPSPLRAQALISAAAAVLSLWPIFNGNPVTATLSEYAQAQASGDFTWFFVVFIQSLQDFIGLFLNIAVAYVASSLASTMTAPKKNR